MKMLQYVVGLDDSPYMLWQAEILLYNFQELSMEKQLWFSILYPDFTSGPSTWAEKLASYHSCLGNVRFYHNDNLPWRQYKGLCKVYATAKILEEIPTLGKTLFMMDTDIMFSRPLNLSLSVLEDDCFHGSDTASYLSFRHFHKDKNMTREEIKAMTDLITTIDIDIDDIKDKIDLYQAFKNAEKSNSVIGAQILFKNVDAAFFYKINRDAWNIYQYLAKINAIDNARDIQVWCADMIAILLNAIQRVGPGKVKSHPELCFSWATDPKHLFEKYAICHFAGVVSNKQGQFNKQNHSLKAPWNSSVSDFEYITNTDTCAQIWLETCRKYASEK